jgi:hypothetical protein
MLQTSVRADGTLKGSNCTGMSLLLESLKKGFTQAMDPDLAEGCPYAAMIKGKTFPVHARPLLLESHPNF